MRKFHLLVYGFIFTILTLAVFVIGCGGSEDSGVSCEASPACCSTSGGIQTTAVLVKASDCNCPAGTTYNSMDNVTAGGPWKICTCNGC